MAESVQIDDMGYGSHSGYKLEISVDRDGSVQFVPSDGSDTLWAHPRALVAALKDLGVLPEEKRPAPAPAPAPVRRIEPSERVRESWRKAAAEDENYRAEIERHAYARRMRLERERQRLAKLARPRYWRDRQGDVWKSHPDGRLSLHTMRSGQRVDIADPRPREFVTHAYGPLVEVPEPRAAQRPPLDRATAANYWAQTASYRTQAPGTTLHGWAERVAAEQLSREREAPRSMEGVRPSVVAVDEAATWAQEVARLREQARRDINDSVWRRF